MNVTVRTVKLTKSIINQMREACIDHLGWECIGYVVNCRKGMNRAYILTEGNDFRVLAGGWQPGATKLYRKIGKYSSTWDALRYYDSIVKIYKSEQIFI